MARELVGKERETKREREEVFLIQKIYACKADDDLARI